MAPPTSLPDSTPPTLVRILRRTVRMAVCVLPTMSQGLSASMAEVATMFDSVFHKRFRLPYESSPSSSPLDLRLRKCYRGTSELTDDDKEEEDDEEGDNKEEDKEIEEISNSDRESEDEGPTTKDEDYAARDEGLAAGNVVLGIGVESLSLGGDEAVPEGQPRAALVVETAPDPKDGIAYIDVPSYPPQAPPVQTPPSPEWSSGSLLIYPTLSIVSLPISSPMIPLTVPSPIASPATTEAEGF
nr:hypothetical protein [Tanacetum cinerariifolium]